MRRTTLREARRTTGCICYYPLFYFNQFGDLEQALLHQDNIYNADDWHSVLEPVVARYCNEYIRQFFRGEAALANADLYSFLEEENYLYAIVYPLTKTYSAPLSIC